MSTLSRICRLSLENVRTRLTPVFERYGILKAIVFGSVARGRAVDRHIDLST